MSHLLLFLLALNLLGCGGAGSHGKSPDEELPWVVRFQASIPLHLYQQEEGNALFLDAVKGSGSQPVVVVVAPNVTFTLSNSNFSVPSNLDGIVSFGSLDITALRDNALRVCGANGRTKCTRAAVRTYTTGTPGDGLWSATENYGLPIASGSSPVPLSPLSLDVGSYTIPAAKRVLRLADLTSAAQFSIPYTIDFSDAAAADDYATTLVVEYVLQ